MLRGDSNHLLRLHRHLPHLSELLTDLNAALFKSSNLDGSLLVIEITHFFTQCTQSFSFTNHFIAVPKCELLDIAADAPVFVLGMMAAFFSALWAIKGLLRYISQHDFLVFAWYRLVFGAIVLITAYSGVVQWSVN